MSTQMRIAALIYMMIQGVVFGIGIVLVLATPLREQAFVLMPVVVIASFIAAVPIAWFMAPRLQARFWRARGANGDVISGPAVASSKP